MKIVILEDRLDRLQNFKELDLENHSEVEIMAGANFDNLLLELKTNKTNSLDKFACIASHRSAMSNDLRNVIKTHCKIKKVHLVFFSGGISASAYKDGDFPFLNINSRDFYSGNLKFFLEQFRQTGTPNLLILQFGLNWKINLLLNLRNDLIVAVETNQIKRINDLKINTMIKEDIAKEYPSMFSGSNLFSRIDREQVYEFKKIIDRMINDLS